MKTYDHGLDVLGARPPLTAVGAGARPWDNHDSYWTGEVVYYDLKYWRAVRPVEPPFVPALMSGEVPGESDAWRETSQPAADLLGHRGGGGGGHHHGGGGGGGGRWRGGGWRGGWGYPYAYPSAYYTDDIEVCDPDLDPDCDEEYVPVVSVLPARRRLAVLGMLGPRDIAAKQDQMDALKQVPVGAARILLKGGANSTGGMQAIASAIANAKQPWYRADLPGDTTRKNVQGHLQWHADALDKISDPNAIYASGADLKKWVMQAFIEQNATEEGAAEARQSWSKAWSDWADMWVDIAQFIAALPREIAKKIVENVTGVPLWAWVAGSAMLAGLLGYGVYKIASGPAGGVVAGVVARRYLG